MIVTEEFNNLSEDIILSIYDEEILNTTEGQLFMAADKWCRSHTNTEEDAKKVFMGKFVPRLKPKFMSKQDFCTYIAKHKSLLSDVREVAFIPWFWFDWILESR